MRCDCDCHGGRLGQRYLTMIIYRVIWCINKKKNVPGPDLTGISGSRIRSAIPRNTVQLNFEIPLMRATHEVTATLRWLAEGKLLGQRFEPEFHVSRMYKDVMITLVLPGQWQISFILNINTSPLGRRSQTHEDRFGLELNVCSNRET